MRRKLACAALVSSPRSSSSACLGDGHSINAYAGKRSFDASELNDVDEPTVYGVDGVLKLDFPWLGVEGGWFHSDESSSALDLTVDDYFVGLRVTPWDFL